MSTDAPTRRSDARRAQTRRRQGRAFAGAFAIVVAVIAVIGFGAAAVSVALGPRVTDVSVDPEAAVSASGSRVIFTTTQSLADVDPSQVTITPETPFAVDTSGRTVGVRFALALREDTEYTVSIDGVTGIGGGPATTLTETFRTAPAEIFLLQRGGDAGDDTIFATSIDGENAVPVFTHEHIEDFRATASHLVVSVRTADDAAALIVMAPDGTGARELPLPGDGYVTNLQAADRGERIGYTYSDADLTDESGLESILFTASLSDAAADAEPTQIEPEGVDSRVAEWRFVPDTDSVLMLTFDSTLLLADAEGGNPATLGNAVSIEGVAGTEAIVERVDGTIAIDLTDASEQPLVEPEPTFGLQGDVLPAPGGGTLRIVAVLGDDGLPERSAVAFVDDDGAAYLVTEADAGDAVLGICVSPSGRYLATLVAPDIVDNPYDQYLLPLPAQVETRISEIDDGSDVVALSGSDISWCRVPPR
ncbi:hypothetical protein [Microbacterium thalassium]|uniref:SbsA Ig-like domain-containing protein n=1 Tax=Microbacterium thalassium TaxID=362649 RepID=A0A7X0FNQ6_9MICO|nr:hypothetical protein [Microbacterium thalassium]MBB6390400.1 hypothetical protein [Microbacterium thalassium]GLK25509.1 hypothetical protein GCM10017607_28280 [Microbacterium thalassium]